MKKILSSNSSYIKPAVQLQYLDKLSSKIIYVWPQKTKVLLSNNALFK